MPEEPITARELLLHLTLGAAISDHRGDMARDLDNAYELLGMKPAAVGDDGWYDYQEAEARGGRSFHELLEEQRAGGGPVPLSAEAELNPVPFQANAAFPEGGLVLLGADRTTVVLSFATGRWEKCLARFGTDGTIHLYGLNAELDVQREGT